MARLRRRPDRPPNMPPPQAISRPPDASGPLHRARARRRACSSGAVADVGVEVAGVLQVGGNLVVEREPGSRLRRRRSLVGSSVWARISAYRGSVASSSAWVPSAMMRPSSTTATRSARLMVESRWAMMSVVRPSMSVRSASWICCSICTSIAEVASSSTSIGGLTSSVRAIASRWRCPPESVKPRSPPRCRSPRGAPTRTRGRRRQPRRPGSLRTSRRGGRRRCCRGSTPRTGTARRAPCRSGGAGSAA